MSTQARKASAAKTPTRRRPTRVTAQKKTATPPPLAKTAPQARRTSRAAAGAGRAKAAGAGRSAVPAVAEVSDLVAQASQNTLAASPLIGIQSEDIAEAARSLLNLISISPTTATEHYSKYLKELGDILKGDSEIAPDPKDRRFADPAWKSNFLYKRLMQAHLASQKGLSEYIESSSADKKERGKAQFFASLMTDALAPSNWLLGNPAAVRKIVDTGGESLVNGLKNMLHDMQHNNMLPSQVDSAPFKVGENVATSPGQVVHRSAVFELIQYAPTTPQVHRRPLVMSPPQINKFYAVDLAPEKSLVKWTVDSGVQMFVVSWRNPRAEERDWGLAQYVLALDEAVDVARQITGSPDVNMWGSCSGGMTLAAYLGYLAAIGERKVANTTWAVCILNTATALDDSTLGLFNSPATISAAKARSRSKGVVEGSEMASMFAWLRPNDLIWNYWVNNYLLGNKPPAYDILAWNADTTRLPAQFHSDLLDMVEKNPYVTPGALHIAGHPIDMRKVDVGAYVVGGITDHITPWPGCYGTARLMGDKTTFVLANAGHLQSLINPPGPSKSFYFVGPASVEDPQQWVHTASRHEGSWWPHWRPWIQAHAAELVDAPKKLGSNKHKALCPAPGEYVLE